jgi:putative permease
MIDIFRRWFYTWFADEEAIYLFVVLLGGLLLVVFFGEMLAPVLTGLVLAYLMQGVVTTLQNRGMNHFFSVLAVFLLFLGGLVAVLGIMLPMVWRQTANLVREQLPYILSNGETWLRQLPERYPQVVSADQMEQLVTLLRQEVAEAGQSILSLSLASIPGVLNVLLFLVLVPVLVFFFLKDKNKLTHWVQGFLPRRHELLTRVWHEMDEQIANYVRGKALEILIVGAGAFFIFLWLGLNYALLLAVMVGLSVIVPYVGATVVTLPVAVVGWVQFGWSSEFAMVMLAYGVIQFIDGNILVPLLFSEVVNLHPVAIIVAILFFGGLWGLWGVFFAIPLATLLKAVIHAWPRHEPGGDEDGDVQATV